VFCIHNEAVVGNMDNIVGLLAPLEPGITSAADTDQTADIAKFARKKKGPQASCLQRFGDKTE
jgi:hypothetical protein